MFGRGREVRKRKALSERRMQCFCLGAAKTGTTSLAAMFTKHYWAAHEPEATQLTQAVASILGDKPAPDVALNLASGSADRPPFDVVEWLRDRDARLNLELEASHPLGYMAPWLPLAFPDARYVVTLREPRAWLKSRLNFHYYKAPPQWQSYRDLIWSRWHRGYHREEALLERMGLYSVDAYLAQYSEQYRLLLRSLPETRVLLVRTELLDASASRLGNFLSVDPKTITRQHANTFSRQVSVIDQLSVAFVEDRISEHCGWMRGML